LSNLPTRNSLSDLFNNASDFNARNVWLPLRHRIPTAPDHRVNVVDANRFDAHKQMSGLNFRLWDFLQLQHFRTASPDLNDRPHFSSPSATNFFQTPFASTRMAQLKRE
jgi:hypothetical protein